MYRIKVYSITGSGTGKLFSQATVVLWSKRINAPGRFTFTLPYGSVDATPTNLQKYKRVKLFRKKRDGTGEHEVVWYGYVEDHKRTSSGEITVFCVGALQLFRKRYTAEDEQFNGQGSTEALGLLSDTNSNDGDTGITAGSGGVTGTKDVQETGYVDVLKAWEDLAAAHTAEFEIDDAGAFNFVDSLGSDKSSTVTLEFRRDGTPGGNLVDFEEGELGRDMANKVIGTSTAGGGLTSTKDDATSQTTYGVLIERKQFNEAQDQSTLDAMTQSYLTQRAEPIQDFQVVPDLARKKFNVDGTRTVSGIDVGDVAVGDLVSVEIVTENQSITSAKRIAEIIVNVDENNNEVLRYTLTKSGVFITARYLDAAESEDIRRRLQHVEAQL